MKTQELISGPSQEVVMINTKSLSDLFIYLSGVRDGRGGNLHPLGTIVIDDLQDAIMYLRGDNRFKAERDIK